MADHPVLDRHPKWRARADPHGLSRPDEPWLGWLLVCAQGPGCAGQQRFSDRNSKKRGRYEASDFHGS